MGDKTGISWTDATWNPVRGCSRVSEGCRNCYAERVAARFSDPGQAYEGLADRTRKGSKWTGVVRLITEHLADPLRWKKPRRIFVNSMSDLFHENLTNEQIAAVFGVMGAAPQHTFQVLTKRAKRMREWSEWIVDHDTRTCAKEALLQLNGPHDCPWEKQICADWRWPLPNVWLGVSVENQAAADERIPELLATPAAVRFLSCEPLIGAVEMTSESIEERANGTTAIGWVIAGCESGPDARPCDVAWLRSLRDQCAIAHVPFFLKQAVDGSYLGSIPGTRHIRPLPTTPRAKLRDAIASGDGSKRKGGNVIELPYLDGVQHAEFPCR